MPTFASSWRATASKARPVTNSETVNPMPAIAEIPTRCRRVVPAGKTARPRRSARKLKDDTPTTLPTTRPKATPRVMPEVMALESDSPLMSTPALARANTGMITKPVTGWSRCSIREATETDSFRRNFASLRSSASSWSNSIGGITALSSRGLAGARRPMATPAMVVWTPDLNMAYQRTDPSRM